MATWLDAFESRLNEIKRSKATLNSPVANLNDVALAQLGSDFDPSKFINNNPNGVGEHLLDWGGRALDVISRPGYAVGGFLNDVLKDATGQQNDENSFAAALEGLTGKRKEFFEPASILNPHEEGESGLETGARFATDFLASILTDPITYVPGGAIAKGAKSVGDLTGATKLFGKAQETLKPALNAKNEIDLIAEQQDALAQQMAPQRRPEGWPVGELPAGPVKPKIPELPAAPVPLAIEGSRFDKPGVDTLFDMPPGAAQSAPPANFLEEFMPSQSPGQFALPLNIMDEEAKGVLTQKALDFTGDLQQKGESAANKLALFQIVRSSISDALSDVRGTLNFNDVKSPWKETRIEHDILPEPKPREFSDIPEPRAGIPYEESVFRNTIKRSIIDSPETIKANSAKEAVRLSKENPHADVVDMKTARLYFNGEELDFNTWVKNTPDFGDITQPENFLKWVQESGYGKISAGVAQGAKMTPVQYANLFLNNTGKAPKGSLRKKGKSMPIGSYVTSRKEKWRAAAVGATPAQKAAHKKAVTAQEAEKAKYADEVKAYEDSLMQLDEIQKTKPTRQELEEFLRANKIVLSAAEKKRLLNTANLGNETGFMNLLKKFSETERKLNIDTIDDLVKAVKSGRVEQRVLDDLYSKLGVSTPGAFKKKLESMDSAIERYRDIEIKNSAKQTDAMIRQEAKDFKTAHDPKLVGEKPSKIKEPLVPVNEATDKATTKSESDYLVEQAEAIVDKVVTPDVAALIRPEHKARLVDAVQKYLSREWRNFKQKHPYKSPKGAGKTDPKLFEGFASWFGEFNYYKQANFFSETIKHLAAEIKPLNVKGNVRAAMLYDQAMPMMKAFDEVLRSYGIHPTTAPGKRGYPLSLYDVLSSVPRKEAEKFLFNSGRQIQPTQWMEIADMAMSVKLAKPINDVWGGGELLDTASDLSQFGDEVTGLLDNTTIESGGKSAKQYAETQGARASEREMAKTSKTHGFDPKNAPSNFVRDAQITGQNVTKNNMKGPLRALITEDFVKAIQAKVAYNSDRAGIQYGEFVAKHVDNNVRRLMEDFTNAKTNQEILDIFNKALPTTERATLQNTSIIPPIGGMRVVLDDIEEAIANPSSAIASQQARAFNGARNARESTDAGVKTFESSERLAQKVWPTVNLADNPQMGMWARMVRAIAPHLSEGQLRSMLLEQNIFSGLITAEYSTALSKMQRTLGSEKVKQLFHDVRAGHRPIDPNAAAEFDEMRKVISRIFDDTEGGSNWSLKGNGIAPAHINANLRHFGINKKYALHGNNADEAYSSWREWDDINDPLDFLSRYHAAAMKSLAEKSFGEAISSKWGVKIAKPGYVKISADRGSRMRHLIDTNRYYPAEIAQNMRAVEMTLREMAKPGTENRLARIYDSAIHKYKTGLTIYRPGHHMRNLYGDIWLGYMDGVSSPRYYTQALKVMATRKNHFQDFNFEGALGDLTGNSGHVALSVSGMKLTNDDVFRLGARHGLYPDYRTIEDLNVGAKGTGEGVYEGSKFQPLGGKFHKAAASFSETRDHYVRTAHFLKAMEDAGKKIKPRMNTRKAQLEALSQMASEASERVRKWHPNGADLTQFEKSVMRRTVLFYSWMRKAIPLVVESFFTRPGRFLAFPKGMYNLAEANGIDLNGFSDPFPTDQLFPTWLGGTQGPVFGEAGSYLGMRPGIPQMDILDQYFTSPAETFQTLLSSASPVVKVPYELGIGKTAQGIPIKDTPKYLLGQIPFGNFVNTMVGKPIGGVSPSDEGYDPGGIRDSKALATINMLTGLGLIDMSKPSYIKSGEFDAKYGRQGQY